MRATSQVYNRLIADENHTFEVSVVIGEPGVLITRQAEHILFGGFSILVDRGGAESGFRTSNIVSLSLNQAIFQSSAPSIGNCISAEVTLSMIEPAAVIPRMAQIIPYVRVVLGNEHSEWVQLGTYFIDTREQTRDDTGVNILTLHGFDRMLMTEQDFPISVSHNWPATDIQVVRDIAATINADIDARTVSAMTYGYSIQLPSGYSCRDTLSYIASLYGGNWIFNNDGELQLILYGDIPADTRYLIDNAGYAITFGGDRILV